MYTYLLERSPILRLPLQMPQTEQAERNLASHVGDRIPSLCLPQSALARSWNQQESEIDTLCYIVGVNTGEASCVRDSLQLHITFHQLFSTDSTEPYPQPAQSLDGPGGSSIPLYRSSEEEKRVTVIKAPHYPGIGPVDESGIPTAIRTVGNACVCVSGSAHRLDKGRIVHGFVHS